MTDPVVQELVARLDADRKELFEERAGIRQFDGGLARELAEPLALLDVLALHPMALMGTSLLRLEGGGYVLALSPECVAEAGLRVVGEADLAAVLHELGGVASIARTA